MLKITSINGPIVKAEYKNETPLMYEFVYIGKSRLIGEIISINKNFITIQVYEDTTSLKLNEPVFLTGSLLSASLGPGLLGSVYDGIQRELFSMPERIQKGIKSKALNEEKKYFFKALKNVGDEVKKGEIIGEVDENGIKHRILSDFNGILNEIENKTCSIKDTVAVINGNKQNMIKKRPLRIPGSFKKRLSPKIPLITGQRVIDFMFPIAKGGSASIPGGFGTGKTILQQTLAKYCDADIIIYIGCGERGNEMTEVLEEFPNLTDPYSGKPLMNRTVLIANTSDMPVSAREASIYLGITIGEYFRDQGYNVALMADSTSRWAEAMRELSSRMGELPMEEGYPADISSKIASVYERASIVETFASNIGSLSIIGAVSPAGGDFSEPVTIHTKRFTSVFWALDKSLANARFYPAINYLNSYSNYELNEWWEEKGPYIEIKQFFNDILQKDASLQKIVKLLGVGALPEEEKITLYTAELIKEAFLQQNAFDETDAFCTPEKQIEMAKTVVLIHDLWRKAFLTKQIPVDILKNQPVISEFIRAKYEIKNEEYEKYIDLRKKIESYYNEFIKNYGE
ncbi:ATP synthase alpha/beta family, nucleotide-binding domain protein [Nautilia profundicola AmH]|uniref:V-type ATP synthase alpha chain n=1 Tax=Nautilia profundicola (strain ATCC BAA-1463 / DSM 18972 / AmH) TaxID=598659 RepID=B9L760_NAUPA|nr:V-type ATP synthase subunit A [Nautilia profundicola]ACM92196.1 ATP synthase alpha/beta family, nucleotide-binding domain protein [Nautilia profundicola AmH]